MNILILTGGESGEREVAIRSGKAVARALCSLGYNIAIVDTLRCPILTDFSFTGELDAALSSFDKQATSPPVIPMHPRILDILPLADKIFPALHGGIGENGTLSAAMQCVGAKSPSSPPEALANAMNKQYSKLIYESAAIYTPAYTVYSANSDKAPIPPRYPCVVKPIDGGSSVGISLVFTPSELAGAIERAFAVCKKVILEELIIGREFSVSVLCDKAIAVTEIIPKSQFYDYDCKYINGGAREITPAPLPKHLTEKALCIAERAHASLGLKNFSRTDLILKKGTDIFFALETNALPGLTETSILPSSAAACGISFPELCKKMLF